MLSIRTPLITLEDENDFQWAAIGGVAVLVVVLIVLMALLLAERRRIRRRAERMEELELRALGRAPDPIRLAPRRADPDR